MSLNAWQPQQNCNRIYSKTRPSIQQNFEEVKKLQKLAVLSVSSVHTWRLGGLGWGPGQQPCPECERLGTQAKHKTLKNTLSHSQGMHITCELTLVLHLTIISKIRRMHGRRERCLSAAYSSRIYLAKIFTLSPQMYVTNDIKQTNGYVLLWNKTESIFIEVWTKLFIAEVCKKGN